MKEKILITGASGCLGKILTTRMLNEGYEVSTLTRRPWKKWGTKNYVVDIGNFLEVKKAFTGKEYDRIYHLATYGAYPGQEDWNMACQTNIIGTINLLSVFGKNNCGLFVNTSSSAEYITEPHNVREEIYSKSKQLQSNVVRRCFDIQPVVNLILFHIYGPGQANTRLVDRLIKANLSGDMLFISSRDIIQALIYTDDVMDIFAMKNLQALKGKDLKIHGSRYYGIEEIIENIERITGKKSKIFWGSEKFNKENCIPLESRYLRNETSLAVGIAATADWIEKHDM